MSVPEGSCAGTGGRPLDGSIDFDRKGRETGVCPVFFRISDELLPHHAPSPNLEATLGQT